ncbi:TonB-dependent receptor [Rapidithrix thailandica]|uniref:TonB-dependent receptor n=1 Tax=Rapidithrix thailandica TaxID=413964 RepID=A0AAW9SEZ2_9BACT
MNKYRHILPLYQHWLTLLLLGISLQLSAQSSKPALNGRLVDATSQEPLVGASVLLKVENDSLFAAVTTDQEGVFVFSKVPDTPFTLQVSYIGYETYQKVFQSVSKPQLGNIPMKEDTKILDEVKVEGKVPVGEVKGDTVVYNANAFKTRPDADAENLIGKMPGIVIDGGTVKANGEDVKQVLVDGKPFFGNDPNIALKNLPAEVIDKIEVFDKKSEQAQFTGFDDGETSKTINIVTRVDKRNGQFGKIYAGGGLDEKYMAGGNLNFFNGKQRISVIGMTNNVNQQNFSTQDLLGVVGSGGSRRFGGGRGGGRRGGGMGASTNDFLVGSQNGITTTDAFGINFQDEWGKKIEINANYFYNRSANTSKEVLSREYLFSGDSSQYYQEESFGNSNNFNHRFNLRMDYKISDQTSVLLRPSLNFQSNNAEGEFTGLNRLQDGQLLSQALNRSSSEMSGYNISNLLLLRHKFAKRGRTFSVRLNTTWDNKDGESQLWSLNQNLKTDVADTVNQLTDSRSNSFSYNTNVSYTEPIGKTGSLQVEYSFGNNNSSSDKRAYQFEAISEGYTLLDSTLSNVFENDYFTQRAGLGYRIRTGKLMFMANVSYQHASLENEKTLPDAFGMDRSYTNLLPRMMLRVRFDKQSHLRLMYRTRTSQPSISQLQDVVNNANPLQLSLGNPALDQSYAHTLSLSFRKINPEKSTSLIAMVHTTLTNDYIGNKTTFVQQDTVINGQSLLAGGQYSQPVNLNGSWNVRSFFAYGFYLKPIKSNLNMNTSVSFSNSPNILNEELNETFTTNLSQGLVLSSNINEKVDFTLSTTANYNIVRNSLQESLNNNYYMQKTGLKFYWNFWKTLFFDNNLNHQFYSGLSEDMNQSYFLWNMSAGFKFTKNNRAEVKLTVFDLLDQNQNIQRNVTNAYIEDSRTEILQQYYMLTFTYNLRNFGNSKS